MSDQNFQGIRMSTGYSQSAMEDRADEYIENETVRVIMIMDDALRLATTYMTHAHRNGIAPNDIILALKVRGYYANQFMTRPGESSRFSNFKDMLEESLIADEESETMESEEHRYAEEENWTRSLCECYTCKTMNEIDTFWSIWTPSDIAGVRNKKAVEAAMRNI